jgi:hypothetical protein
MPSFNYRQEVALTTFDLIIVAAAFDEQSVRIARRPAGQR